MAEPGGLLPDLGQGHVEVLVHVDRQGAQRRDVEDLGCAALAGPRLGRPVGGVDGHQEPGQRLARSGGRRHEHVAARCDVGPGRRLGRRRAPREAPGEPAGDRRVEQRLGRGVGHGGGHCPIPPGCSDARDKPALSRGAVRPQQATIGGWARSSRPAATASTCRVDLGRGGNAVIEQLVPDQGHRGQLEGVAGGVGDREGGVGRHVHQAGGAEAPGQGAAVGQVDPALGQQRPEASSQPVGQGLLGPASPRCSSTAAAPGRRPRPGGRPRDGGRRPWWPGRCPARARAPAPAGRGPGRSPRPAAGPPPRRARSTRTLGAPAADAHETSMSEATTEPAVPTRAAR